MPIVRFKASFDCIVAFSDHVSEKEAIQMIKSDVKLKLDTDILRTVNFSKTTNMDVYPHIEIVNESKTNELPDDYFWGEVIDDEFYCTPEMRRDAERRKENGELVKLKMGIIYAPSHHHG
jgi:hypothetical protein